MSATDEMAMPSVPTLDNMAPGIGDDESTDDGLFQLKAAVAIAAVLLAVAYWFLYGSIDRSSSNSASAASLLAAPTTQKVNGVVLVGCCGAGKTVMLHQLTSGVAPATLPSMTPAYHAVELPSGKSVQVVDVPGHQRLRLSLLQHLKGAKGLAFVLDASAGAKSIKQAAALLFDILASEELHATTPLLVFCNKSDLTTSAKSSDRVQGLLEREIDALRKTHGTMEAAGDSNGNSVDNKSELFGSSTSSSAPFKFSDLSRRVEFGSGSAADPTQAGGFEAMVNFLETVA